MRLFERLARDEWNIGLISQPIEDIVHHGITSAINWLPSNSWRIFADPFCIVHPDHSVTILAEMLNHWFGRGEIWSATIAANDDPLKARFRPHIAGPVHLSYPSYIQDGSTTYAVVESHETGALFIWVKDGVQWRMRKKLLDRPAVDPSIYHDGELWWLFCTFADDQPDERLHLFYSPALLGSWLPHPSNPVVADRASARPAGALFKVNGMLIRPSQDSSITYGGQLVLNQVTSLNTRQFTETPFRVLAPQSEYYCDGIHTIASAGEYTMIDGKRWHHGLSNVPCRLSAKMNKTWRRRSSSSNLVQGIIFTDS